LVIGGSEFAPARFLTPRLRVSERTTLSGSSWIEAEATRLALGASTFREFPSEA
jgi:hypothetical protein